MSTDLFSAQSSEYQQFRPEYPDELYLFLVGLCKERNAAWDCATGNGQAAIALSRYFKNVMATDLSQAQIKNATPAKNIEYQVLKAEESLAVENHSFDLITVAQAIHWFDLKVFYPEVKRLLKPDGIFATWAYAFHEPISPEIDALLNEFYFKTLGPYWKSNNDLIANRYRDLAFPFQEVKAPEVFLEVEWNLERLMGYFRSWSATQLFKEQNQVDPTLNLYQHLLPLWGNPKEAKSLKWNLILKVGR